MATLLIEMPAGVAGDMLLAALIDLGGDRERLLRDLAALGLGEIEIDLAEVHVNGIRARRADVRVEQAGERWLYGGAAPVAVDLARAAPGARAQAHAQSHDHGHGHAHSHAHDHVHRPYRVIRDLLARAPLPGRARERAQKAFRLLAESEGAVHGMPPDDVEFHEVGSLDAIVDVVGCCLLLEQLDVDRVVCGPFTPGEGHARCAHGVVPVPVPAVARMLADARVPQRRLDRDVGELTTPTGCAIVLAIASTVGFAGAAPLVAARVGYGAGHKRIEGLTNAVRLSLLADTPAQDVVSELRCEIDDATGEQLGALIDELLAAGAKDAYLTPVLMKKGRPGHLLTALAPVDHAAALADLILARSTSIGVRASEAVRRILPRRVERVVVDGHTIALKVVTLPDGSERAKPEADDVIACARATSRSFADVAAAALAARGR